MNFGRRRPLRALAVLMACLCLPAVADEAPDLDALFERDVLVVVSSGAACWRLDVWLATTPPQRARGLMHVRRMPPLSGMLFVYDQADYHSMWMKNTYIPLDMVFARADGSVSSVVEHTEPMSLASIPSIEPVSYVLELNAGAAERLAIDDRSRLVR